jgi:hypothetical protein
MWTRNLGSTHNDESYCVKPCRDSGFVIAGYKSNGSGNLDFYIIKTYAMASPNGHAPTVAPLTKAATA